MDVNSVTVLIIYLSITGVASPTPGARQAIV